MELPKTTLGNRYVVFQDFLSKFPLVYLVPDQKSLRIVRLLVEEVVPLFGVPEALLSDRGNNLLSHLMQEVCQMLGVKKLNTTAYHPQCDGMVERFNCTLKTMLHKHAAQFGVQWDTYLYGVLWAYKNTPHESTGEKPSFLLYGHDCRSPTEATLLPPARIDPVEVTDYCEEMVLSLSEARRLAAKSIRRAQHRYKSQYDKKATVSDIRVGDWVFVRFPQEESGRMRKLSRPWHGPYRVCVKDDANVTVTRVYFPSSSIQVHLTRVVPCPPHLPAGFYWYGSKWRSSEKTPKWVENLLQTGRRSAPQQTDPIAAETDGEEISTPAGMDPASSPVLGLEDATVEGEDEQGLAVKHTELYGDQEYDVEDITDVPTNHMSTPSTGEEEHHGEYPAETPERTTPEVCVEDQARDSGRKKSRRQLPMERKQYQLRSRRGRSRRALPMAGVM